MSRIQHGYPRRIICLTEETTEALYAIGADDLLVGVSGFTVRPRRARKEKATVSTYLDANIEKILELKPDLVIAWSDLQAGICADLIRAGVEVLCFNHRSVAGILSMLVRLGALIGRSGDMQKLVDELEIACERASERGAARRLKPRVYFEEWYDPLISGICWVSEIIELCGGLDVFAENRHSQDAKGRIIADHRRVIERHPDIMLASWCGKMFKPERVLAREGWEEIPAIQHREMHEIHSSIILQPGPAALSEGLNQVLAIFDRWEANALKTN